MDVRILVVTACALLAAVTPAAAADFKVMQKDKSFSESDVHLRVGDRLTFVNADTVTHNVYSRSRGLEFEITSQVPGSSDSVSFRSSGVAEVQCAIHPKMKLQIHVAP